MTSQFGFNHGNRVKQKIKCSICLENKKKSEISQSYPDYVCSKCDKQ